MGKTRKLRLHIGCGDKYLPGFLHYDVRMAGEHIDYIGRAEELHVFADGSLDEIYACHIVEHFGRHVIDQVLQEWNRVLKVGGVLRISVPDFEAITEEYKRTHNLPGLIGLLYGGQTYEYNYHYMAYDFDSLGEKLERAGFCGIERYDWQEFLPDGFDDYSRAYLPHMDFENGRLMCLNVVCRKNFLHMEKHGKKNR